MKRLLLILLLLPAPALSLDTPSHGIQGGLLAGSVARLAGGNKTVVWSSFVAGAIVGMAPDAIGATGPHRRLDWPNYTWAHDSKNALVILTPYALHLVVDRAWHERPGENWWQTKRWQTIAVWALEALLVYMFTKWIVPEESR